MFGGNLGGFLSFMKGERERGRRGEEVVMEIARGIGDEDRGLRIDA